MIYTVFLPYFYPRPPRGGRRQVSPRSAYLPAISIHALREEGDRKTTDRFCSRWHFYPRPPRGGRPCTHLFRNSPHHFYPRPPRGGRPEVIDMEEMLLSLFLSTPSARRATTSKVNRSVNHEHFYPRPPRGGRLQVGHDGEFVIDISIHALCEEGDPPTAPIIWPKRYFYPRPLRGGRHLAV